VTVRSQTATGCRVEALAAQAGAALFEMQVLQAPHIAESQDAAMTRMEDRMAAAEKTARRALEQLQAELGAAATSQLAAASAALDRFKSANDEIVSLSRRNTNVRSLALSFGRKRMVTAEGDDSLRALEQALASHGSAATR